MVNYSRPDGRVSYNVVVCIICKFTLSSIVYLHLLENYEGSVRPSKYT